MRHGVRRPDPIQLVEAAYTWEPDEARWLDGLVSRARSFEVGGGVIAFTVRVGERSVTGPLRCSDGTNERDARAVLGATEAFPVAVARQAFAPTEFIGNATYRLARIARTSGVSLDELTQKRDRFPQMWALVGGEPSQRSVVVLFPRHGRSRAPHAAFPHRERRALGLVSAHLGAAVRLRGLVRPTADDVETEAVLTPGGRMLHAVGPATDAAARESLAFAVAASERARGRMRRAAPDEALRMWTALVSGRWTILDTVDHDGKRLILARANPMRSPGLLDLTSDERDVAWLAALGHSYKYIAYELGYPVSTVSSRLRRAMDKLRVVSRQELLQRIGVSHSK